MFYHPAGLDLDETAILDGVTITGGNATGGGTHDYGGGMYNENSSPTLTYVTITGNYGGGMYNKNSGPTLTYVTITGNEGSGMHNTDNSNPTLRNVVITENYGYISGAGMRNENSSPTLINVTITKNNSKLSGGTGNGGGMYNSYSNPTLRNVTITENDAANDGGGMYNYNSSPTLTNVTITENVANNGGGMYNNDNSKPTLTNVEISENSAQIYGGGLFNAISSPILTNVTITENVAINGGGMFNAISNPILTNVTFTGNDAIDGGGMLNAISSPNLTNVLIAGNYADSYGGGMYNEYSSPSLTNVTIAGNYAHSGNGGGLFNTLSSNPLIRNSIIYGNGPDDLHNEPDSKSEESHSIVGPDGNDPWFEAPGDPSDAPTTKGNYRLRDGSPAINAGDMSVYDPGENPDLSHIVSDLDGNPRFDGFEVDLGAYEFQGTPAPPTLSAIPGDGQVTLKWNTISNADKYSVYQYEGDPAPADLNQWNKVATVSATAAATITYIATGLTNGKTYTFAVQAESNYGISGYSKVTAKPEKLNCTVTFDKNGGDTDANPPALTIPCGSAAGTWLPAPPAWSGYEFVGWNTQADGSGDPFDGTTNVLSDIIVYAQWRVKSGVSGGNPDCVPGYSTNGQLTLYPCQKGEVSLRDAITVIIPAWAADRELTVTIREVTETQQLPAEQDQLLSPVFEISKTIPGALQKPATIILKFDSSRLKDHQQPSVFFYDEAKKIWVELPAAAVEGERMTVTADEFGKVAVFAAGTEPETSSPEVLSAFRDMDGHWAADVVRQAAAKGIVAGYPDGTFRPDHPITRAEFTVMLVSALQLEGTGAPLPFTDRDQIGPWAAREIGLAVQAGIVRGYEDGTFRPDAPIIRAEMAVMVAHALKLPIAEDAVTGFADDEAIPRWAKGAVKALRGLGIVSGRGNNEFVPRDTLTRAEAAAVLLKMLEAKEQA